MPLPPVWETPDAVLAFPPVEPDPTGEVELPVLVAAANALAPEGDATDNALMPVGPESPAEVEPPMLVIAGNGLAPECSATDDVLMPLPPVEPGLLDEIELTVVDAIGDTSESERFAADNVLTPLPPVEPGLLGEIEPVVIEPAVVDAVGDTSESERFATDNVLMPLPPVELAPDDTGVDVVAAQEATPVPLPSVESRSHGLRESLAIAMIGDLFVPIATESRETESREEVDIRIGQSVGSASVGEVTEEETSAAVGDDGEVPHPLPPVKKDSEVADSNGAEAQSSDPRGYERSWDLELIAQEADKHTRRGFGLAGKKAHFSARLEFTRALRIIAQGLDTQRKTNRHSQALAGGLRALVEAEEFLAKDGHLEAELDLDVIVGAHRTPVLRESDLDELTPMAALHKYHNFAQDKLSIAMGKETAGSMALYGLGKLHAAIADQQRGDGITVARPKAMVLLQAALITSPANHMASNELGVLLAKNGRQMDARKAFEHSVATCPTAEGWRNLALTCEQLGEMDTAYRAAREALAHRGRPRGAASSVTPSSRGTVHWVSPAELANRGGRLRTASAAGAGRAR